MSSASLFSKPRRRDWRTAGCWDRRRPERHSSASSDAPRRLRASAERAPRGPRSERAAHARKLPASAIMAAAPGPARRCVCGCAGGTAALCGLPTANTSRLLPPTVYARQILHRAGEAERAVAHPRIDLRRWRPTPGHPPTPGQDGDVLHAVIAHERHRLADEAGVGVELPQLLAGLGVDRLEPAIHRSVEGDVAGGHQRAAPDREFLCDRPHLGALDRVPGHELAAIPAGSGIHVDRRADIGRAGDVADLAGLEVHAEVLVRHVEQLGARRPRGRLPVLRAGRGRTDVLDRLAERWA